MPSGNVTNSANVPTEGSVAKIAIEQARNQLDVTRPKIEVPRIKPIKPGARLRAIINEARKTPVPPEGVHPILDAEKK